MSEYPRMGEGRGSWEFPKHPMSRIDEIVAWAVGYSEGVANQEIAPVKEADWIVDLLDLVERAVPYMEEAAGDDPHWSEQAYTAHLWLRDVQGDTP